MTPPAIATFRDPLGHVTARDGRIFRTIADSALPDLRRFLATPAAQSLLESGAMVRTFFDIADAPLDLSAPGFVVAEHEAVPFPSYPYEWAPSMLHSAAALTLRIARLASVEGFGIKDATPYNVLFRGPNPVFVDLLSFEPRTLGDPTWLAHAQFLRLFLLPLLALSEIGLDPRASLLSNRDGIEPKDVYRWLPPMSRLRPRIVSLVSAPVWLDNGAKRDAKVYQPRVLANPEKASFIYAHLLRALEKHVAAVRPRTAVDSRWTGYATDNSYTPENASLKQRFVADCIRTTRARRVLDIGCNTGDFSVESARNGATVVAADSDPAVIERLWRRASEEKLDILPLTVDIARPTPAMGWKNAECPSFLDRARGMNFDCVLMLALLHHLIVTEGVPLDEVVSLAADLTAENVIIEYVGQEDPMFRAIARGREHLHRDFTLRNFESACRARFEIVSSLQLPGSVRGLYHLRKKGF